jgi:hypothetical protein
MQLLAAAKPGRSDRCWRIFSVERCFEKARGGRGASSLKPLIVVRREVQQSSLGKLVRVLSKAATAISMRFQEVRIHDAPRPTTALTLHSPSA